MLNEVKTTITSFGCIPKRLMDVYSSYIAMLMVKMKDHTFRAAAQMSGLHESRFCAMLNDPRSIELSKKVFNRAKRRRLKRIKGVNGRLVSFHPGIEGLANTT